jgi:hypothetical protein
MSIGKPIDRKLSDRKSAIIRGILILIIAARIIIHRRAPRQRELRAILSPFETDAAERDAKSSHIN